MLDVTAGSTLDLGGGSLTFASATAVGGWGGDLIVVDDGSGTLGLTSIVGTGIVANQTFANVRFQIGGLLYASVWNGGVISADFAFGAIPEPAAWAALAGLVALVLTGRQRQLARRQRSK